ncbi:50S ribosomal protein L10 [Ectocarpus siliculosus]|uniref:50S ribosomal protein L10 n=1 Tax=Ectocarpus siliculosus TaxID=2880 RepID=D8LTB2_ECTSI|nr:50S ribosomal protein L10 [Ectocarpus siliculosus]|eukprot:CBN77983.1 50S ribosomal protein L10 [Ectocarpus siliculosus]
MKAPTLAVVLCAAGASAFVGTPVVQPKACATTRRHSSSQPLNMAVIDTTKPPKLTKRPAKLKVIEEVKSLLESSSMVFSVPSSYISANQVVALRKDLPEGCTAKVVKNKLMRIASDGSEFAQLADVTTGENFWIFIEGEDNLAEPIKYVAEFAKQFDKDTPGWGGSPFKSGVFGGDVLDGPGVVAISKLPTKKELMQRLAIAVNSVPTKLGRSINLVPTKVGRAVKLAFAPEEDDAPEGDAAAAE